MHENNYRRVRQRTYHVTTIKKGISKIKQETNLRIRCIESRRELDNTMRRYQRRCSARRVWDSVKREIKSEGTRGGISTWPKWWRSGRDWRKRRRSSHDTQRTTMEPISVVGRWHS